MAWLTRPRVRRGNSDDDDHPIPSPVTGGGTSLADVFDAKAIINRWKIENIDVARYFRGLTNVQLRRCEDTGYRFFHPPSLAGESEFYDFLDPECADFPDYRHWSGEFQFALDRIHAGDRVLDVGCGYGYFLERARERADAVGVEGNVHAYRQAVSRGMNVRHGRLQDFSDDLAGTFDLVCAFQVLEHIFDVADFFEALCLVLKPGGRLIIAVPNNDPYFQRFNKYATWNTPPHHVGLWDLSSLQAAGRHFGLVPIEHAYLDISKRPLGATYLRTAFWMRVKPQLRYQSLSDKLKIVAGAPFALPLTLYDLATLGRTEACHIAVVFEKPG